MRRLLRKCEKAVSKSRCSIAEGHDEYCLSAASTVCITAATVEWKDWKRVLSQHFKIPSFRVSLLLVSHLVFSFLENCMTLRTLQNFRVCVQNRAQYQKLQLQFKIPWQKVRLLWIGRHQSRYNHHIMVPGRTTLSTLLYKLCCRITSNLRPSTFRTALQIRKTYIKDYEVLQLTLKNYNSCPVTKPKQ